MLGIEYLVAIACFLLFVGLMFGAYIPKIGLILLLLIPIAYAIVIFTKSRGAR